jgi:hypothetical protein
MLLEEWKEARAVLARFDEDLHDLRKFGFSFITALLSLESFLLPSNVITGSNGLPLADDVKTAVLLVTLVLVFGVQVLDRNYQVYEEAAATRAIVIERKLNLELTDDISVRYAAGQVKWGVNLLYWLFIAALSGLGVVVLWPNYLRIITLGMIFLLATVASTLLLRVRLPYGDADWTVDALECDVGEKIGITVVGLGKRVGYREGERIWEITDQDNKPLLPPQHMDNDDGPIVLRPGESYTWLWDTSGVNPGIYEVWRSVFKTETRTRSLRRRIGALWGSESARETELKPLPVEITVNPGSDSEEP